MATASKRSSSSSSLADMATVLPPPPPTPMTAESGGPLALTPPPSTPAFSSELTSSINRFSMASPVAERNSVVDDNNNSNSNNGAAPSARSPAHNTESFFAQNRAILLSGLPRSPKDTPSPGGGGSSSSSGGGGGAAEQHAKTAKPPAPPGRRLTPLVTLHNAPGYTHLAPPPSANSPLMSPRAISPCVYVKATGPWRKGGRSSSPESLSAKAERGRGDSGGEKDNGDDSDSGHGRGAAKKATATVTATVTATTATTAKLTPPPEGRLYVTALVRPAGPGRESFAIEREFDLQALLKAVPQPDHRSPSTVHILPSPVVRSPLTQLPYLNAAAAASAATNTNTGTASPTRTETKASRKRAAPDASLESAPSPHPSRRQQSRQHSRQSSQKDLPSPDQYLGSSGIPIPIRPHPALGGLPGLAAVILSGHIHAGDVIELPLPHPEAWTQTVSYVYKNHGDLTDAVRENIAYLGGKLDG
ncbi:hypothetical protein SPI_08410 [Niveomyces insectorum RCEF 264]|uniref:Uncharacterized protein n=1 Tax=Niveomyces insectorum RCEF 264 TaxID=1081102 RepID=A0A162ICU5_9HYPO|nr:hypothetical protein SPI_08410 [Niveomyces insectorum RCEF 264]